MKIELNLCKTAFCFFFLTLFIHVHSHSWIACTDYAEKNAGSWDSSKCRGFPRNAHVKVRKDGVFGLDAGYDHRPGLNNVCNFPYDSSSYTDDHPMAVYYPGQQVVLVHPMKNHGADGECQSIWIPDTGSWLLGLPTSGYNNDSDLRSYRNNVIFNLGRSPSGEDYNGDSDLGSIYPKPGYANAPLFCQNTDKALATYSFNVPRNLNPGRYTFVWLWAFNSERDLYSTCFEVDVVRNRNARNTRLRSQGFNDLTEPCGGLTSNPNVMGNSNQGCIRPRLNVNSYAAVAQIENIPSFTFNETSSVTPVPTIPSTDITSSFIPSTENPGFSPTNSQRNRLNIIIPLLSSQFSGEIFPPNTGRNPIRRYLSVDFSCSVELASFWNCQVITDPEETEPTNHYDLIQQGPREISTGYIFYHVSFQEPCDLARHPPVARLVREEYQKTN